MSGQALAPAHRGVEGIGKPQQATANRSINSRLMPPIEQRMPKLRHAPVQEPTPEQPEAAKRPISVITAERHQ